VAYILNLLNGSDPSSDSILLDRFVIESSHITKYLSRVVKDKALAVYHVLFHLSWFETGQGVVIVPWAKVGSYIRSDQGNIIDDNTTVKRRLGDLLQKKCISVERQRSGANIISVYLPSEIAACRKLIDQDQAQGIVESVDLRDHFTNGPLRLLILDRDGRRCVYCRVTLSEDSFVLDHLMPMAGGGTNHNFNLVVSCQSCNQRKQDQNPLLFLLENYRVQLLTQSEFLEQKVYVEHLLGKAQGAG
jgi:hypothetical protein